MSGDQDLVELLAAVQARLEQTTDHAVVRMVQEAEGYRGVAPEELRPVIRGNLAAILEDVAADGAERVELFREAGRVRARQGVSVEDMLHGWRIGLDELRRTARSCAEELEMGDSVFLAFTERSLAWADRGMLESAAEHRRAELEIVRREQHARANLVREILMGALSAGELRTRALAYGLDLGAMYTPFRLRMAAALDVRAAERALGVADAAGPRWGLAALIDGDLAGFTARLPATLGQEAVAGIGPPAPLDGLVHPFALASRALDAALALGLSDTVEFATLGVLPAVLADDDVARPLHESIIAPVLAAGRSGATILGTVRRYVENDRRLSETARELHTHVNTIRNRLARFEEITGRDLRRSADLVETWWALQRSSAQAGPGVGTVPVGTLGSIRRASGIEELR